MRSIRNGLLNPGKMPALRKWRHDARAVCLLHPLDDKLSCRDPKEALAGLKEAEHTTDLLDLYAEGFDPILNRRSGGATTMIRREPGPTIRPMSTG